MIKKCDFKGCDKAGTCRAPKSRALSDYYWFCKEHAAEYNKNWDYYAGMSREEIDADWERETFGIADKDRAAASAAHADYVNFLRDFLTGKSSVSPGDEAQNRRKRPAAVTSSISAALRIFELPPTTGWREVSARYRVLAKKHHPDTAKNKKTASEEFTKISAAYAELKKWLGK